MPRFAGCFGLLAVALLAGCVSVQEIPIAPTAADGLRGRVTTIATRERPDFGAMTPGRAAIGGLIGGAMMIELGNRVVRENNIEDPSPAIARALAAELEQRHALSIAPDTVRVDTDEVPPLAKIFPQVDLLLDVRTINWSYMYFATAWNRYRVMYTARLRLIDVKRGAVLAEGGCKSLPEQSENAPTGEELLANGAQRLKSELAAAAQFCLQQFRTATFAFAGPAPTLYAAAPAATAAVAPAVSEAPAVSAAARVETVFWESIRASADPADFRAYLDQYPNGMYAEPARQKLAALAPSPSAAAPAPLKSASSPLPQRGDAWRYRLTEYRGREGQRQRRYDFRVEEASANEIVEHYSIDGARSGEWKHSSGAYLVRLGTSVFSPYLAAFQDLSAQPALGRVELADPVCGGRLSCEATAKVVGREVLKVPAGTFETVKVRIDHEWRGWRANQGSRQLSVWYAPAVKRAVKFSSRSTGVSSGSGDLAQDFDLELESYRLE